MRARILAVVAVVLAAGVALADPAIRITPAFITQALADARYLLLSGGTVTGQTTFTADPASTAVADTTLLANPATCAANEPLLGAAVAGSTRLSVDCEGDVSVVNGTGVVGASTITAASSGFRVNTSTSNLAILIDSVTAALYRALIVTGAIDARASISNSGASNGGAVHVADTLTVTGDITTNGEIKSTATGAFFYISSTTPAIAARPDRVDLYVAARSPLYQTWTNCADSAGAAACTAAPAGHVVVDDGATSVVVTSTAFGSNTQCFPMFDASAGARLGVTCNTAFVSAYVSARSGTTQTWNISSDPAGTDPVCLGFFCVNQ